MGNVKTAKDIISSKINIKSGDITFGQRIDLGKVFETDKGEFEKFSETFEILHDFTPALSDVKTLAPYFNEIVDGLRFWIERENTMLKYEPTPEEIKAGVKDLANKIGELGTIKSIAKTYGQDPDEVLNWKYGKVFGILFSDLEEYKYQVRYNKVVEIKYKNEKI